MKKCSCCKILKSSKDFYKCRSFKDGLQYFCKKCSSRSGKYGKNIRIADKLYQQKKRKLNSAKKLEETNKYNHKYPERYKAIYLVSQAIKKGIIKKLNCRICGRKDTQGHHSDYSKPLDVDWLCPIHHKLLHLGRL
jgi:hypothetical protein